MSIKGKLCKEWIKKMPIYISNNKKYIILIDKKEKIEFVQGYLKDMIKRV